MSHDDAPDELLPRRFGPRALAVLCGLLALGGGFAYLARLVPPEEPEEPELAAAPEPTAVPPVGVSLPEPRDAAPQMARNFDPDAAARNSGILGTLQQEAGHFLATPHGGAFAAGDDDEDVWGGLAGTEIGEASGLGGLGLIGSGRGGGGYGSGSIGLGSGTGQGFGGRGHVMSRMRMSDMAMPRDAVSNEGYDTIEEHRFISVADDARSTFAVDVDTASYSNVRRFLNQGQLPPADAVRVEEFINYFDYADAPPTDGTPFSVHSEVADCPWDASHLLVRLGLQGQVWDDADLPARNFVFLLDVSGSMESADRLPLVRNALGLLVDHLRPQDRVGIVVYAGASGVVLEPTAGTEKDTIRRALARLGAGGSTNGGAGIELAYRLASQHFVAGGANRVILATDGDFNVGVANRKALVRLIERKRDSGVFLSVLGVGRGNLQDATMEDLADRGNGNYAYLDSIDEARKVLVDEAAATLVTIAKDVKVQVEFDPSEVASWRLIGYENRKLAHRDFEDDRKDAGEIGAGHRVTALYEIVPKRGDDSRMSPLMKVGLRWKAPDGDVSTALEHTVGSDARSLASSSDDFRLAAAAAQFAMLLRNSGSRGDSSWASTITLVEGALGEDPSCDRVELAQLVGRAAQLSGASARPHARTRCPRS
jgi:Ca-activated chloride channel family protein